MHGKICSFGAGAGAGVTVLVPELVPVDLNTLVPISVFLIVAGAVACGMLGAGCGVFLQSKLNVQLLILWTIGSIFKVQVSIIVFGASACWRCWCQYHVKFILVPVPVPV